MTNEFLTVLLRHHAHNILGVKDFRVVISAVNSQPAQEEVLHTSYENPRAQDWRHISIYKLLYIMKDWITHWEQGRGVCSHKTFYTQYDGHKWYAGFSHVHTTYDDKIMYKDEGSAKTEYEAVLEMANKIYEISQLSVKLADTVKGKQHDSNS